MELFSKHSLSGKVISLTSISNYKKIIYQDLSQFLEGKTIDIMFDAFDEETKENRDVIQSKSAPEIAYMIFHYPFQRLLKKILNDNIESIIHRQISIWR